MKRGLSHHDIEVDVSSIGDGNIHVAVTDELLELCAKHKHLRTNILKAIAEDLQRLTPISEATQ